MDPDSIRNLSLQMRYEDIKKVCETSEKYNQIMCNELFWTNKIKRDFPDVSPQELDRIKTGALGLDKDGKAFYERVRREKGKSKINLIISMYEGNREAKGSKRTKEESFTVPIFFKSYTDSQMKDILYKGINGFLSDSGILGSYEVFINENWVCRGKSEEDRVKALQISSECFNGLQSNSNVFLRIGALSLAKTPSKYKETLLENIEWAFNDNRSSVN